MRSEVSKKNPYWLPKERYLELLHYSRSYKYWLAVLNDIFDVRGVSILKAPGMGKNYKDYDPVAFDADRARYLEEKIKTIDDALSGVCSDHWLFYPLFRNVTEGMSYDKLNASKPIPCGRRQFYEARRRYFWLLDRFLMGNRDAHIS